jgi:hypothetical protein
VGIVVEVDGWGVLNAAAVEMEKAKVFLGKD